MKNANTDQLTTVDPTTVSRTGVEMLTAIQEEKAATQVQTLSLMNLIVCQQLGLDPRKELERASRVMSDADGNDKPEVRALREYVKGELK